MAKPPAGSSLLFGALAASGQIKQRKNGSYRMVLDGVDEIDWFTDRPNRVEGTWKPQKLLRRWDKYFATSEPNAQIGFKADEEQEMATFEMFKPKMKSEKMMFNVKPISDSGEDKLTGLKDIELSDILLFIDDATNPCLKTVTLRLSSHSGLPVTVKSESSNASFGKAVDVNGNANLSQDNPYIFFTAGGGLFGESEAIIEIPVTLTMGIKSSQLNIQRSRGFRGMGGGTDIICTGNPIAAEMSYSLDGIESGTIEVPCAQPNGISPTINWG